MVIAIAVIMAIIFIVWGIGKISGYFDMKELQAWLDTKVSNMNIGDVLILMVCFSFICSSSVTIEKD